jgi:hypothetical protein
MQSSPLETNVSPTSRKLSITAGAFVTRVSIQCYQQVFFIALPKTVPSAQNDVAAGTPRTEASISVDF